MCKAKYVRRLRLVRQLNQPGQAASLFWRRLVFVCKLADGSSAVVNSDIVWVDDGGN